MANLVPSDAAGFGSELTMQVIEAATQTRLDVDRQWASDSKALWLKRHIPGSVTLGAYLHVQPEGAIH